MDDRMDRTTTSVLAHVAAERAMQTERYSWRDDSMLSRRDWDQLIKIYLAKPGASRYIRLVQVAALAVAAAEREPSLGSSIALEREPNR
jgi:hypothetical protein